MDERFFVSVRGVAIKDRKILMVKEKEDWKWETPGGRIAKEETLQQALRREFKEETGYDIEMLMPLSTSKTIAVEEGGESVYIAYQVDVKERMGKPQKGVELKWMSKRDVQNVLNENDYYPNDREVLLDFVEGLFDE